MRVTSKSRLADPRLCPDCRTALRGTRCPRCGLVLTGPLADRLWQQMLAADATITELRLAQPDLAPAAPPPAPSLPAAPLPPGPRRTGLDGRTVPVVLLTLGGLLVFVAVSLFLAVTWSDLPLALKALIMVAVTTAVGVGAAALTRKELPGAAETVWTLTAALLALDLSAAWRSNLAGLHAVPVREMTAGSGLLVAALGVAVSLWSRRTPVRVVSTRVVAGLGLAVVTFSEFMEGDGVRPAVGVVLLAATAYALHRALPDLGYAVAALGVLVWLDLASLGIETVEVRYRRSEAWTSFAGWPLLVAAGLAAVVTLLPRLPRPARTIAAGAALGALATLAVLPVDDDTTTVLLGSAALAALAGLALVPSRTWSEAAAFLAAAGAFVAGVGSALAVAAAAVNATDVLRSRVEPLGARLPRLDAPAGWTLLVVAVVVLVGLYAAAGHVHIGASVRADVLTTAPAVLALAAAGSVVASPAPLWVAVLALVTATLLGFVPAVLDPRRALGGAFGLYAAALAIPLATRSDLLTGAVCTAFALVALVAALRSTPASAPWWPVALGVAPLAAAADYGWGRTAGLAATPLQVTLELVASAVLVGAPWVTQGRRRIGLEVGGAATLAVVVATVLDDPQLALGLSLAGSAVALMSVLHPDRRDAGWVAAAVLALGTLVRFADAERAPELYALPAAAVLLAAGWYRLRRQEEASSWAALGSGLNLALLPSLLLALEHPAGLRGLLVGAGALVALGLGVARRWQAPYLTGAVVLAALALRFLLPLARDVLANPLGAWMLFGAAGAALLSAGILWEQSLHRLRSAGRYVGALV